MPEQGTIDRERLAELFEAARELPPRERRKLVIASCGGNGELEREILSLLRAHDRSPDLLDDLAGELLPATLEAASRPWPEVGQTISHYHLEALIDTGGMGVVYRARDLSLDRPVALKFVRAVTDASRARARLESEARAASALDHPNIAVVYEIGRVDPMGAIDAGVQDGLDRRHAHVFIAMAHYEGETLKHKLERGVLPIADAVRYAAQIADGLACAHDASIAHRDIKPANIIITDRDEVKIVDFGLAAQLGGSAESATPSVLGTVAYMSPEQVRGADLDHRTDLWSLGVVLYEMLSGQRPFPRTSSAPGDPARQIDAILEHEPTPLRDLRAEVPEPLIDVVATCLRKDRNRRYEDAATVREALLAISTESFAVSRVRTWRWRVTIAATILALIGLLMVTGGPEPLGHLSDVPEASGESTSFLVAPLAVIESDPELERIGRELAVTLSAGLDGLGSLRAADAVAALGMAPPDRPVRLSDAHAWAERLGADRVVHGALTRDQDRLRADLAMFKAGHSEALARASATADSPQQLSDEAAIALLDALWLVEPPKAPSLAAVLDSEVLDARRAYLQGELALARSDMVGAVEAFERAVEADPEFWWAYWRSMYPRQYREAGFPPQPELVRKVYENRWELPEPDRLLVEATAERSRSRRGARLERLTDRFPQSSAAAWFYANFLTHEGPYIGRTLVDARAELERYLGLEPTASFGWDHLALIAIAQRDIQSASEARARVEALTEDGATRRLRNQLLELRVDSARDRPFEAPRLARAVEFMGSSPLGLAKEMATGLVADDSAVVQLQLNTAVRRRGVERELGVALWEGEALAWVARGDWPRALEAAARWARLSGELEAFLGHYRLAQAGALLGALDPTIASTRRPAERSGVTPTVAQRAERGWLDGLSAYLRQAPDELAEVMDRLEALEHPHRELLRDSLRAMALHLGGRGDEAADAMLKLELEVRDELSTSTIESAHPLLTTANRLLAGRWLRSFGRSSEAERLLTWHEAIQGPARREAWLRAVGAAALVDRAELALEAGDPERAKRLAERFLYRHDLAGSELAQLVARCERVLQAPLSGRRPADGR